MQVQACTDGSTPAPGPTPPPGCSATNPVAVALSSPANGDDVPSLNVTLVWNPTTNWGKGCPQDNR